MVIGPLPDSTTQPRPRGVAMLLVVVSVAAAVAVATALISLAGVKVLASRDLIDYAKADYLAESGMSEAAYFLVNPPSGQASGYWTGATNRQLDASGSYYDVAVTQDTELASTTLLPLADPIVRFYDEHHKREGGKILFKPAQALETYQTASDPLPVIAGLR